VQFRETQSPLARRNAVDQKDESQYLHWPGDIAEALYWVKPVQTRLLKVQVDLRQVRKG